MKTDKLICAMFAKRNFFSFIFQVTEQTLNQSQPEENVLYAYIFYERTKVEYKK